MQCKAMQLQKPLFSVQEEDPQLLYTPSSLVSPVCVSLLSHTQVQIHLHVVDITVIFKMSIISYILFLAACVPGPEDQIPSIISGLAMSAKLGIAGAWIAVQVFTAETYPTCIRSVS